jgi:hypothetical protein
MELHIAIRVEREQSMGGSYKLWSRECVARLGQCTHIAGVVGHESENAGADDDNAPAVVVAAAVDAFVDAVE